MALSFRKGLFKSLVQSLELLVLGAVWIGLGSLLRFKIVGVSHPLALTLLATSRSRGMQCGFMNAWLKLDSIH